jgi:YD repeat-containing protein
MAKQMSVNQNGTVRDLKAYWQFDKDRITQEEYPNAWLSAQGQPYHPEFKFGRGYDAMYRLREMSWFGRVPGFGHPQLSFWVAQTGLYDAAGQLTDLTFAGQTEHRTYNNLGQLTGITGGTGQNTLNLGYTYRAAANDGRVETMTDNSLVNGVAVNETVSYVYDPLKRLTSAATTGPQWGLSFGYDGFGNLWSQTVTKGAGPQFSLTGNSATNRVMNYGYDANGNVVNDTLRSYGQDAENRLESVNGVKTYAYDVENLRVFEKGGAAGGADAFYFHAPDGRRLGKYSLVTGVAVPEQRFEFTLLPGRYSQRGCRSEHAQHEVPIARCKPIVRNRTLFRLRGRCSDRTESGSDPPALLPRPAGRTPSHEEV